MSETQNEYNQRKYISELAKKGAKIKSLGRMCNTCAFKFGSDANLEPHNVEVAFMTVALQQGVFNCHYESDVDKGCLCVGYKHAKQYYENKFKDE